MTAIIHIILIVDISYTNCPFKKCQELRELEEYAVVGEEFIFILKKREIFYPFVYYVFYNPHHHLYVSLSDIRSLIIGTFCSFHLPSRYDMFQEADENSYTELPIISQCCNIRCVPTVRNQCC